MGDLGIACNSQRSVRPSVRPSVLLYFSQTCRGKSCKYGRKQPLENYWPSTSKKITGWIPELQTFSSTLHYRKNSQCKRYSSNEKVPGISFIFLFTSQVQGFPPLKKNSEYRMYRKVPVKIEDTSLFKNI